MPRSVVFRNANLPRNRDFQKYRNTQRLVGATFIKCDLRNARFQGVNLDGADFTDSDLEGAQFLDASLKGANLANVKNLATESLGGADLSGASLPEGWTFEGLEGVAEASRYLQSLFKIILALSAFSALTIFSAPDEVLIRKEASPGASLTFISATIALRHFGWIAPLVLLTLFVYMVTYLADTWVQLSKLPAVFPDGSPLDRRAYPLSLNCLIRRYSANLQETPPIAYEILIAYVFMFVVTLCTLLTLWLSYLKLHSLPISSAQALCLSIAFQVTLYHRVVSIVVLGEKGWRKDDRGWYGGHPARWLRRWNPAQFEIAEVLRNESRVPAGGPKFWRTFAQSAWPLLLCFSLFFVLSAIAFQSKWFRVDVGHKVLSHVIATDGKPIVSGPDLEGINLQNADLTDVYLRNADLKDVDFTGATLTGADLTGAEISGCNFSGAAISLEQILKAKCPDPRNPPILPDGTEAVWERLTIRPAHQAGATPAEPTVPDAIVAEVRVLVVGQRIRPAGAGGNDSVKTSTASAGLALAHR